ncbi:uncharacterized protein [Arachis hypogaea]|uniref:uncharacterized protein n=1 Tax=Arachis hypogaea TaxID=3818 RepID=UPI000DEC64DC|nr:uncharacterized protein LOC112739902 [Arachis hypogaea]
MGRNGQRRNDDSEMQDGAPRTPSFDSGLGLHGEVTGSLICVIGSESDELVWVRADAIDPPTINTQPAPSGIDLNALAYLVAQINTFQANSPHPSANPIMDPSSPFFLHPGDSPGNLLIYEILNHKNYNSWSRLMLRALISKNNIAFVDGSLPKPIEIDPTYEAWKRCNMMVVSWINLSLSQDIQNSVIWNGVANNLWEDLKKIFYQGDVFRIAELEEDLFSIKQGDLSITPYFTLLKSIWEELEDYRPLPTCICVSNCNCSSIVKTYRDDTFVVRFLHGLNEQYTMVRSNIMLMKPPPTNRYSFLDAVTTRETSFQFRSHEFQLSN